MRIRSFLVAMILQLAIGAMLPSPAQSAIRAVAFDYFVLFDANSVLPAAEAAFPGKGAELVKLWRGKLFEYNFVSSAAGRHEDFAKLLEASLEYSAEAAKLDLTDDRKHALLDAFRHLKPWPDTVDGLRKLRQSGLRVIALSNLTPAMLRANAESAGFADLFDDFVSTEVNGSFKPEPRAYRLGMEKLDLKKDEILFAAFGGWDAFGAKSFGYRTVWVNRFGLPAERLQPAPDATVKDFDGLLKFVGEPR